MCSQFCIVFTAFLIFDYYTVQHGFCLPKTVVVVATQNVISEKKENGSDVILVINLLESGFNTLSKKTI